MRKLIEAGANVFFTFHKDVSRAKELTDLGAKGFQLNLAETGQIESFSKNLRSQIKSLHVLIHNAATTSDATMQNMTEAAWDEVISINLKAPYFLTKKLLSLLFQASPSKIFFITSRAASQGIFGASNYASSKAGLVGLAKSLAQELGKKQILVNCVNPGFMKSAMTESLPIKVFDKNIQESVLGKISNPEEVADFLIYLSSDHMTQVSGQVFHFESRKV